MTKYCIGTAQFGMNYGIANLTGRLAQKEIDKVVSLSIKNDVMYFDTAQSYGSSEKNLGKAIQKIQDPVNLKVVSKLKPNLKIESISSIVDSVKLSLENLHVKSLHGFLAHRIENLESSFFNSAIDKLKKERLIFKSGVSVYNPGEAISALDNPIVEILQIPFNILDKRWIKSEFFEKAKEKNIQIFIRSIFLQGLIFLKEEDLEGKKMNWAKPYLNQLKELVKKTPFEIADLTFGIIENLPGDNVIIIGVDNSIQIEENLKRINNNKINKIMYKFWWKNLPDFPERLLNPSLWKYIIKH